jgi:hypothetical protein
MRLRRSRPAAIARVRAPRRKQWQLLELRVAAGARRAPDARGGVRCGA